MLELALDRRGSRNFQKGAGGRPIVQIFSAPSGGTSFTLKNLNLGQNRGGHAPRAPPLDPRLLELADYNAKLADSSADLVVVTRLPVLKMVNIYLLF